MTAPAPDHIGGRIGLHHGNAVDLIRQVPDDSVDLILTDPPYMTTTGLAIDREFTPKDLCAILPQFLRVLKPDGWLFQFGPIFTQAMTLRYFNPKFEYIWVKPNAVVCSNSAVRPYLQHETIQAYTHPDLRRPSDLYFNKPALRTHGWENYRGRKKRRGGGNTVYATQQKTSLQGLPNHSVEDHTRAGTSLLEYPNKGTYIAPQQRTGHPTQKPLGLCDTIVRGYCRPGGLVLDPYAGSGTTGVAARMSGRDSILFEIHRPYYEEALARCSEPLMEACDAVEPMEAEAA